MSHVDLSAAARKSVFFSVLLLKCPVHLTIFAPVLSSLPMTSMDSKSNPSQLRRAHAQELHMLPFGWWLRATFNRVVERTTAGGFVSSEFMFGRLSLLR
jgi:hypothetical protein